MKTYELEIPMKLPSLNTYINECRKNRFAGASMKAKIEKELAKYINTLPKFEKPIKIHFHWIESNKRRDLDNVAFAKKFILDSMVKCGKMQNDNRNYVQGFWDSFDYGKETKVVLTIKEG